MLRRKGVGSENIPFSIDEMKRNIDKVGSFQAHLPSNIRWLSPRVVHRIYDVWEIKLVSIYNALP